MRWIFSPTDVWQAEDWPTLSLVGLPDALADALAFCQAWYRGQAEFDLQTSGSTGQPKTIRLARELMEHSALSTLQALGLGKGGCALLCLNTNYIGGRMMLVRAMMADMDLYWLPPVGNPVALLQTHFPKSPPFALVALVPLQAEAIVHTAAYRQYTDNWQHILIGGAAVSPSLTQSLQQLHAAVYATYGMTETISHIALQRLNGTAADETFVTLPGIEIKCDHRGALAIKGAVTQHEWIQTNDWVTLHPPKGFRWLGRLDNIINSGGVKVPAEKVERAISLVLADMGLPYLFFVAGLPHPQLGQQVCLIIESPPWDEAQTARFWHLINHQALLGKYETPKQLYFSPKFVQTASAKIQRRQTLLAMGLIADAPAT
jgi:O-succinylbenzoic acid--CoA ligase